MNRTWRLWFLTGMVMISVVALAVHGPIPQDPRYHAFADQRTIFGIPNFWNVISNLPFLLAGLLGLLALRQPDLPGGSPRLRPAYGLFFVGAILISLGSSYYHLHPSDSTLVWDRLPMTLAFMAFLAIIIGEHIDANIGRRFLPYLTLLGLAAVFYWSSTGDLGPYIVVQFLPMILIPAVLIFFPSAFTRSYLMWLVLSVYAVAKVLELFDPAIYKAASFGGHALKHVISAAAMYLIVVALRQRRPVKTGSEVPVQLFAG